MAPKYRMKTDVYGELWSLLQTESHSDSPGGGKTKICESWSFLMKVVAGDINLDALRTEAARLQQRVNVLEHIRGENHSQLAQMEIEMVERENALKLNRLKQSGAVQSAYLLKQRMVAGDID